MSELQAAETQDVETTEAPAIEDNGVEFDGGGADLAPAEQEQPAASVEGVEVDGPESFKKAINKQHYKFREEERKSIELQRQLDELKAKHSAPSIDEKVEVPAIPDAWADDYESQLKARDEAIRQNERYAAQEQHRVAQEAQALQEKQREEAKYIQGIEDGFKSNAEKLKLDGGEVMKAAQAVAGYGVSGEVANFLMTDPDGPLMVQYLAQNPLELDELSRLTPMQVGLKLPEIKTKSSALKPTQSEAPDPSTRLNGKTPPASRGPAGATFV